MEQTLNQELFFFGSGGRERKIIVTYPNNANETNKA